MKTKQLRTLLKASGELVLSLEEIDLPAPTSDEVIVKMQAAPINPSDIGVLFPGADLATAKASGTKDAPVLTLTVPEPVRGAFAARHDASLPAGNEGAGVVTTGPDDLVGKTVAVIGGATYAEHKLAKKGDLIVLPEGTNASEGAHAFINPLTVLGMLETRKREGHTAIVHTAAASQLGQMLVRACAADDVPLVNVVRKPEQVTLLKELGAKYVVDSSSESFGQELALAVEATGATLAFDAIGGGKLANQILVAMETAQAKKLSGYHRYGTDVPKQVYVYGGLDTGPTELTRSYGLTWNIGGWLVWTYLQKLGVEAESLRTRVARELKTTFATTYAKEITLAEMLSPDVVRTYAARSTGGKYLVRFS